MALIEYNYIIVGSGFFGSICAYELTKKGYKCLVLEKRDHIGGNCYTENKDGINIHTYGPHIFHTSNKKVWEWINQFVSFNDFTLRPVANYKGEIYSLPFNMWTFSKLWGVTHPDQAKLEIERQSEHIKDPQNLEEQAIKLVGVDVYEKLIKGYTTKQWKKDPKELPKEIIKRLPVRFNYDNNYFNDKYQGIPIGGYTQIFEKLLEGIEVKLGVDYLKDKEYWDNQTEKIIYTGPIDAYFNYQFGELEYKTTKFDHKKLGTDNFQGVAMMNYTDEETLHTRCIEHKHFEFIDSPTTWITWEYPTEYKAQQTEPYYPVNDKENTLKYSQYKNLTNQEKNIIFGGRLAEYKYYDMHQVIESALNFVKQEINDNTNSNTYFTLRD
jgi:UDP-galactopyranose mutase